jgi:hypothetical protein
MKRLTLVFTTMAVAAGAPAAATAATPTIVEESFHRSIPSFIACSGFTVAGEFDVDRTVMTFYDNDGAAIRRVTHVHFQGTLTNTTAGKSIDDAGNQVVIEDLVAGTTTVVSRIRTDTEPGAGLILAQVGRNVRDSSGNVIFLAGQNDILTGELADFCRYMAAP